MFAAAVGFVASGLALYVATRQWWIDETLRPAPLPPRQEPVTGKTEVPWAAAFAFVGMAGAVALFAARTWGRVLVAFVLAVAGAMLAAGGAAGLRSASSGVDVQRWWPAIMLLSGLLVLAAGIFAIVRSSRWRVGLGARFDTPSPAQASRSSSAGIDQAAFDSVDQAAWWDALDRGTDPTASGKPGDASGR